MFIKVHTETDHYDGNNRWRFDGNTLLTEYINSDAIVNVVDKGTYAVIFTSHDRMCVKETADEIMEIIGYFKTANDK